MAYELLHHAHTLALKLEAAGVPEGRCRGMAIASAIKVEWEKALLYVQPNGECEAHTVAGKLSFHVTDPLPAAFITAIRGTQDA